jgi:predicted ABC-type sugar transport system permease subunit
MKVDKILLSYAGANFLFMAGGIILLVGSLLFSQAVNSTPTLDSAPSILLLKMVPEKGMWWK